MLIKNRDTIGKFVLLIIPLLIVMGCSINSAYRKKGVDLVNAGRFDDAVKYYEDILKKNPDNSTVRTLLQRAKVYGYYYHVAKARNLKEKNERENAITEYKRALELIPGNKMLRKEFDLYTSGTGEEQSEPFISDIEPPVTLKIDSRQIDSISLRSTPIKQIFRTIGKSYGVNFIFDKDFRDFPYTFEVSNIGFFEVLNQLCLVSSTKYRVIDSASVLIYPNTSFKKRAFDLKGVKVFFLKNVMAEDAKKMLIPLFRDEQIMVQEDLNLNAVVVKGNSNVLANIEKFIRKIDKSKSEVEFDIEILEINRNLLNKIGADFGTTLSTLNIGLETDDGGLNSSFNVNNIKNSNFFITMPTIALNLLGSDENSKILAKPNLRGINGEEIKFMVGDEIPIPQTTLQSIAAGGIESSPVTTYQYKNVGVEIKLTPYIHEGEVTVKLKLTNNFITAYVDQFPVLGKRELENVIRLREGESSIIGGFIRDETRGKIKGIPALSKLPVIGRLFGSSEDTIRQTDVIFSITPRFIREVKTDKESRSTIWSDSNDSGSSGVKREPSPLTNGRRINPRQSPASNSLMITPGRIRVQLNNSSLFSVRMNSGSNISTLSLSGIIEGGRAEIEDLDTSVIKNDKTKILKNFSGSSFDIGYSFFDKPVKSGNLAKLKIKFLEKGEYKIKFSNIYASFARKTVELKGAEAIVTVY
ncbi:MAG: FecR domain-containing protein [Acidobacteriota bacterium]